MVPRLSSIGWQAARAAASSFSSAASSSLLPISACGGRRRPAAARGATAPSDTRAAVQVPLASSVRLTPAPTTAMSISVRGMKRR